MLQPTYTNCKLFTQCGRDCKDQNYDATQDLETDQSTLYLQPLSGLHFMVLLYQEVHDEPHTERTLFQTVWIQQTLLIALILASHCQGADWCQIAPRTHHWGQL